MELGDPPLYAVVNRVVRDMDRSYLGTLGPYIACLNKITEWSELKKDEMDRIVPGRSLGGADWNIAGSFLAFKGGKLEESWIKQWKAAVVSEASQEDPNSSTSSLCVNMPGFSFMSENLGIAL